MLGTLDSSPRKLVCTWGLCSRLCYSIYFSHLYKTLNKAIEANPPSLWLLSLGGRQWRRGMRETQRDSEGQSRGWPVRKSGGKQEAVERTAERPSRGWLLESLLFVRQ